MSIGVKTTISKVRRIGVTVLCWSSLLLAILAGPLLARMFVGDVIKTFLEAFPWDYVPLFVLVVLVCFFIRDMIVDGKPNYLAIASVLIGPSVASASNGELSEKVAGWTNWTLDLVADPLYQWAGTKNAGALAVAVATAALIFAQRTVKPTADVSVEA